MSLVLALRLLTGALQWREKVDDVPVRVLDLRVAHAPKGVPGSLVAGEAETDELLKLLIHAGNGRAAESEADRLTCRFDPLGIDLPHHLDLVPGQANASIQS